MSRFLLLLLPVYANAAEMASPPVSAGTYVQAGLALALIVSLLFGAAWLAKKLGASKKFGQGNMKIVGGTVLGPRERIVLLEVGDQWLVVGIVPGQIRTLHRMDKGASAPADSSTRTTDKPFTQWLQSISARRNNE